MINVGVTVSGRVALIDPEPGGLRIYLQPHAAEEIAAELEALVGQGRTVIYLEVWGLNPDGGDAGFVWRGDLDAATTMVRQLRDMIVAAEPWAGEVAGHA